MKPAGAAVPSLILLHRGRSGGPFGKAADVLAYPSGADVVGKELVEQRLPDGTVLSTGGRGEKGVGIYTAELWNPATEMWTTLATMQTHIRREYHAVAVLLRDGRIFSGGGEPDLTTAEIFNPPYLFKGARPTIGSLPKNFSATYGSHFDVSTPDTASVDRVSLIRLGAVTHANNWSQRFMWLHFTRDSAHGKLVVHAPAYANLAPPGYYLLFVLNSVGVPSVGEYVRIGAP